jgi:hypothetical protein
MITLDPKWIRVSSILSMIPSLDSNGKWTYPMQKIDYSILERKADLGTAVHEAIAAHINGDFCPVSERERGYLDSYLKWEKTVLARSIYSEQRLYHEALRLTGCVDMIAKLGNSDKLYLIDFKCTVAEDPVKWPLQAAFYVFLAQVFGLEIEKTAYFVRLEKDGGQPDVYEYEVTKELTAAAFSFYNAYIFLTRK